MENKKRSIEEYKRITKERREKHKIVEKDKKKEEIMNGAYMVLIKNNEEMNIENE